MNFFKSRLKSEVTALFGLITTEKKDYDEHYFYWMGISIVDFYQPKRLIFMDFQNTRLKNVVLSVTELISLFYTINKLGR